MVNFQKEKTEFLKKRDRSKKGSIDEDIVQLIKEINSKKYFYTTSSCAGRIVLLQTKSKKKIDCKWIFKKHGAVKLKEIFDLLSYQNEILFRVVKNLKIIFQNLT